MEESEGRFYERGAANNLGNRASEILRLMRFVPERRRGVGSFLSFEQEKENVFLRYRNQRSRSEI